MRERPPLPHDIATEQELLGAILLNNQVMPLVQAHIDEQHFYEPLHREIFQVCDNLIRMKKPATPTTVRAFLPEVSVAGMPLRKYLAQLAANATTVVNAPEFARIVRDLADYRDIIMLTEEMVSLKKTVDPSEIATAAIERLGEIVASRSDHGAQAVSMAQSVTNAIDAAAVAFQHSGKPRGVSYGLSELNERTLGAHPGHLIVIAGRPGMGKTALAVGITRSIALQGLPVWFYSGEMDHVDLTTRMISDHMWSPHRRLTYWQISAGRYREEEFQRIMDAGRALAQLPIKIEPKPNLTMAEIGARAQQFKRQRGGLGAVVIDHLGWVRASGRYAGNKVAETGEISQGAKALAKELGAPVFLLCQLNRSVETREDKRPNLSDLRNSGDIEQDADVVMMLYREAYYLSKKEPRAGTVEFTAWTEQMERIQDILEIALEKNRHGPGGIVRLRCDIPCNVVRDEVSDMDDSHLPPVDGAQYLMTT